jgi:hypothetical protein
MAKSTRLGMQTFDQALFELYEAGLISYEDALRNADSKNELRLRIKLESKREQAPPCAPTTKKQRPRSWRMQRRRQPRMPRADRQKADHERTKPLFKLMVEKRASDLFFTCNAPVKIKIDGRSSPSTSRSDAGDGAPGGLRADDASSSRTSTASWRSTSRSPSPASAASASTSSTSAAIPRW